MRTLLKSMGFITALMSLTASCASSDNADAQGAQAGDEQTVTSLYDISPFVKQAKPWPAVAHVWRKSFIDDTLVSMNAAYELWDFNDDGRVDLAGELNATGQLVRIFYDFDLDGVADARRGAMPVSYEQPKPQ